MATSHTPRAVSAPGKVLVAGGYLVLDADYNGLVFGLDARIHVHVEPIRTKSGVSLSEITVQSPQFNGAQWAYGYRLLEKDGGVGVTQLAVSHDVPLSRNPFIETALTYGLSYISTLLPDTPIAPSSINILASKPYYSNPGTPSTTNPNFLNYNATLSEAHKTGLGSSAALVTSFTAALLSYYLPASKFTTTTDDGLRVLHNLAQAAHCAAQGKVGSGFDVASAVYGSCLYRRFSPSLLSGLPSPKDSGFATELRALVEGDRWDTSIAKAAIKMPKGLRLVMCDVDCGSETPGMVKTVLKWREQNKEEADRVWNALQQGNEALARELTRLATEDEGSSGEGKYDALSKIILGNRKLIREMGVASKVPIEPPQQTALLDACSKIPGVVGGVVPGAGGYDAIVLLLEDREEVIAELKNLVSNYSATANEVAVVDGQDDFKIGKVGILGVREDMVGVRDEDASQYQEWTATN
ncbi:phosphomevalonate kinase [Aaosphaeria arxii CBS 175.79]|uniref:Phosphomevalonate kinase n=1 Tax=Aaosphaeria arxii CBS 175.79 TaxID=1450172 RepID=A0A6A5Y221_9PLEO|nr:phosphomevalonate kinase [Aaosphaeria arxii CBS 175.79]KAF2018604.1 phosphomevalonate kinase [Aaosphaeria arxii CBS 175.79]